MDPFRTLSTLNPADSEKLNVHTSRFRKAWNDVGADVEEIDLNEFLPTGDDALRLAALHELIRLDMEERWRRGKTVSLGAYLKRYRELGPRDMLPARLIFEEYRIRQLYGDKPDLSSYRERFPKQFAELNGLLLEQPLPTRSPSNATPPTPSAPQPAPNTIPKTDDALSVGGGYRLIKRIGAGNFGEVWRAEAPGRVEVAIKIIRRPLDHEEAQRELQALELIKGLRHPFLLQTQAFWSLEDRLLIVMDLADGSLRNLSKESEQTGCPVAVNELLGYFREAAEALDFLHAKNVQHRDIKPDNILLLGKHIKVADFGLAKLQGERSLVTATGSGTPAYMSPEIWSGKVSYHSDQYSLAVTYAELRLNRRMFPSTNMAQIMLDHLQGTPDLTGMGPAERCVMLKALAKEPDNRHPSCVVFVKALEQAVRDDTAPPPSPIAETPERLSRLWANLGAAAVVMFLFAALTVLALKTWWDPTKTPTGSNGQRPNVEEPWLPEGYRGDEGAKIVSVRGQKYYEAIAKEIRGDKVKFLLIRQEQENEPATFYMMENKVWNGLFEAALLDPVFRERLEEMKSKHPFTVQNEWQKGAQLKGGKDSDAADPQFARLPVFRVSVTEAYFVANWLGGQLPTARQWYKAAGKYNGRRGPFEEGKDQIAVDRLEKGPMAVGTARSDRSIFGCLDMAGNGMEWTRDLVNPPDLNVPVTDPKREMTVLVVGRNFAAKDPLVFSVPREELGSYDEVIPYVGFRVVLERQ